MERRLLACKCAEIEKSGGDVREFLRSQGFISPWGTWFRLQKEELGRKDWQITDGRGDEKVRKLTLKDKESAVEVALNGGNPLRYLKDHGAANPSASWAYIKKTLKTVDPEKYDRLNAKPEVSPVTTCCAPARASGVEVPDEWPEEEPAEDIPADALGRSAEILEKAQENPEVVLTIKSEDLTRALDETPHVSSITKPVNYDGFEVTGLRTDYGRFQMSSNGYLFFGANADDELEMPLEIWRKFAADLPRVMAILGVDAQN